MSDTAAPLLKTAKKEAAILAAFLFFGLAILPVLIWFVGKAVFGEYGGAGYAEFYGTLSSKVRGGDLVAWFLVLSPWLALQLVRLAMAGWRLATKV